MSDQEKMTATKTFPAIEKLFTEHGFTGVNNATWQAFVAKEGLKMAVLADNPDKRKTTLDIAVIAPELKKLLGEALVEAAWADFTDSRRIASFWGVRSFPAVLLFIDSDCIGIIAGLQTYEDYCRKFYDCLTDIKPVARSIVIGKADDEESGCAEH